MTTRDWLMAGVVAACVAAVTVAMGLPPTSWATGPEAAVAAPQVPPVKLSIPSIEGTVSAEAEMADGRPAVVTLTLAAPPSKAGTSVPVTVTILRTDMLAASRMMPAPRQVVQADTSLVIGADGKASAKVELPLASKAGGAPTTGPDEWRLLNRANGQQANSALAARLISYQMVLSSPVNGKAGAASVTLLSANGTQNATVTNNTLTQP